MVRGECKRDTKLADPTEFHLSLRTGVQFPSSSVQCKSVLSPRMVTTSGRAVLNKVWHMCVPAHSLKAARNNSEEDAL